MELVDHYQQIKNGWSSYIYSNFTYSDSWYEIYPREFTVSIGLYDDTGYKINQINFSFRGNGFYLKNIRTQKGYFDFIDYKSVTDSFDSKNLQEQGDITFKILGASARVGIGQTTKFSGRIMSIDEYNAWAKNQ